MSGWNRIYNDIGFWLGRQGAELARLQEQAASGARVLRPSDAPVDAHRILQLRAQIESLQTYSENLDQVSHTLEMSHTALEGISHSITAARTLLSQVSSETYGPESWTTAAGQIDSFLEHVLSLANTESLGRYLFGGASRSTLPFAAERSGGSIAAVTYQGSSEEMMVPVAPGVTYSSSVAGDSAFREDDRQLPVFVGNTGAAVGSATSSVRGDLYLVATHTQTTYPGGNGVAAGTSSADGDTILSGHVLTIVVDGPTKTIALDGGTPLEFQGTEQDLKVTSSAGDVAYVDLQSWAGYTGDIAITGTGKLTIDDGDSYTNLTAFTDNVAVTDDQTGRVLYVNATNILRTGTESVRIPGTHDLFGTLIQIRDVLRNARGLPADTQKALLAQAMTALEDVHEEVLLRKTTSVGARLQAMDSLKDNLATIEAAAGEQAAGLEDADIVQIATDLARTQTLYEMTLAVSARLLRLSLLDFI